MSHSTRIRAAFSLVELLVVIGIIAILVGILLPTLSSARRQANLLQCSSNLRQIFQGSMLHGQEHGGYFPLAGALNIESPAGLHVERLARGLGDANRKRYTYAYSPSVIGHVVAPYSAAIAQYLGFRNLTFSNWVTLDNELNNTRGIWQMFMCPETDSFAKHTVAGNPVDPAAMMIFYFSGSLGPYWATYSDFAFNEGAFGFDYRAQYKQRRLAGKVSLLNRPSETMLLCDAKVPEAADPTLPKSIRSWITVAPALDSTGPVTLADVLAQNDRVSPYRAEMDPRRHKGRMNVCFADGHVETVYVTEKGLERVFVIAK